jgi:hypothetical protein
MLHNSTLNTPEKQNQEKLYTRQNQQNRGLLWEKHKQIQDTNRGSVAAIKTGAFKCINIFRLIFDTLRFHHTH